MPDKVKQWLVPCSGCDDLYPHINAWTAESTEWRNASVQQIVAQLRKNGSEVFIYDNGVPIIDLPGVRIRSFFWQIWATNWPRDEGLQGSLSYYSINNYYENPYSNPAAFETMGARPAGWGFTLYPPEPAKDAPTTEALASAPCDAEHAPCTPGTAMKFLPEIGAPVNSIRWELLRQGLEDSERFYFLANLRRSLLGSKSLQDCSEE